MAILWLRSRSYIPVRLPVITDTLLRNLNVHKRRKFISWAVCVSNRKWHLKRTLSPGGSAQKFGPLGVKILRSFRQSLRNIRKDLAKFDEIQIHHRNV